ncbi:MAG TPA: DUF3046 domain-containing protein [Microbacteriaceae bacterium]|nr:DUF3046 domain-containing protein [Microbacteriaceae bacterium]
MKRSEFGFAVAHQFGSHGQVLLRELVIPALQNRTAEEALEAGLSPRSVWDALCSEMDVPVSARVPVRLPQPRN